MKKLTADERREFILQLLKESSEPLTGSELASKTSVSRQIIVGDVSLLKARDEPIIATSQGYIYMKTQAPTNYVERTVACNHPPERTKEELNLLVDYGVTVKDVKIEHPVYGDLTASILVSNRKEVKQFMERIKETQASYLLELTNGIHLHTLRGASEKVLEEAENALREAGFLINTMD
ncbi:transcription repressor NadR [Niallia sp. XMNu-256]|uniref:transcription repressor NadR n=1 Tax=Niallia sp. XMNu-256 TaxID=3082444 RepID=UPI0030CCAC90